MYMNFTRIYERASGNNVKKKPKKTQQPRLPLLLIYFYDLGLTLLLEGEGVCTHTCVCI